MAGGGPEAKRGRADNLNFIGGWRGRMEGANPDLCAVNCVSEGGERRELPVRGDWSDRRRRCPPSLSVLAPVDPDGRQAGLLSRKMVVEEALGDVQQFAAPDSQADSLALQCREVAR